jgi:uncharacterized membrane protein YedE/YeeE
MKPLVALACGTLFGAGLTVAGMTDPARVIGFLDVSGAWDPTLVVVMASALCISLPAFQWAQRHPQPLLDRRFFLPERTRIDRDLVFGSSLFGVGWGVAGLCPGPAIAGIASGRPEVIAFVAAMGFGMVLRSLRYRSRPGHFECKT